jgi:hypothetical protein
MDPWTIIMIALVLASLIGARFLEKVLRRRDESVNKEVHRNSIKDADARNVLLGCQMQCNGVFEGEFQTKEEARAWLESRKLL